MGQLVQLLLDLLGRLPHRLQETRGVGKDDAEVRVLVPRPAPELDQDLVVMYATL
jgi:hypothetical protein